MLNGLRNTISRIFLGDKVRTLESLTSAFLEAYDNRPVPMTPEQWVSQLGEVDERYIDLLLRQMNVSSGAGGVNENSRIAAVKESRSLYLYDVITQTIIDIWTDYGFGVTVEIIPRDDKAKDVWREFWESPGNSAVLNERNLYTLSTDVLTDGEFFFVFFISQVDGEVTIRKIPSDEITEIISIPDDATIVLFYKRNYQMSNGEIREVYYKDWMATPEMLARAKLPEGAIRADEIRGDDENKTGTDVVMMQVAHRERGGRGWPLMTAGAAWSRAYKNFLQDRAAVSRAVAMYVDKLEVKGGSRAVDLVRSRLESSLAQINSGSGVERNAPPVAGSSWVQNEAINRERMPLNTGASDAEKDGAPLLAQAGLAGRIYPHYLGRGETFRLATATAMEGPTLRAFNRYQLFWSSVWNDIAKIVLGSAQKYNGKEFETFAVTVSTENVIQLEMEKVTGLLQTIGQVAPLGILRMDVANLAGNELLRIGLQTLGVKDLEAIFEPATEQNENEEIPPVDLAEFQKGVEYLVTLAEKTMTEEGYRSALKTPFYGLWSGKMGESDFLAAMETVVRVGIRQAWIAGAASVGVDEEDLTDEEIISMNEAIGDEFGYIPGIAAHIMENSKEKGKLFSALEPRLKLWGNRYSDIVNRARVMADSKAKLKWVIGATEKHCSDCKRYSGKVKRSGYWEKIGARPKSRTLGCKGFECDCNLVPTDEKLTRGKLSPPTGT